MNTTHYLKIPWFITKINEHASIKQSVLNLIDQEDSGYNRSLREENVYTDYKPDGNFSYKKYFQYVQDILKSSLISNFINQGFLPPVLKEVWFQQYYHNYFHGLHNHSGADWTNIYYVELPEDLSTKIQFFTSGIVFTPELCEGCVLTLPGLIPHYSIRNQSKNNQRKTVIVFNVNTSYDKESSMNTYD